MEELLGSVQSGKGEHAHWMRVYAEIYEAETGRALFPGTLNVALQEPWHMPPTAHRFEAGVTILVAPCKLNGVDAFIMRTENNERGIGGHPPTVIEVMANASLRDSLDLRDGDQVKITLS